MNGKKYEGILLCTDYDGTLSYKGVPERNLEAIRKFMDEGGLFTIGTGRANYEVSTRDLPVAPNAPMPCMVGARLWDFNRKESLGDFTMDGSEADVLRQTARYLREQTEVPIASSAVYCADRAYRFDIADDSSVEEAVSRLNGAYKLVFWLKGRYTPEMAEFARSISRDVCTYCSCAADNLEYTAKGVDKGFAVRRLKELLGAHTLICVGDTNGDIPMLRAADIGYAVENAEDAVKEAADRITIHAKDGAIAQIIEDL